MRKQILTIIGLALLSMLTLTAAPAMADPANTPTAIEVTAVSAAWECAVGDLCVWENRDGAGRRCAWTNADNDWWSTPTVCSWADDTKVESFWNRGTSTNFRGVKLFQDANFTRLAYCVTQGARFNITDGGALLRSHKWDTWVPGTC